MPLIKPIELVRETFRVVRQRFNTLLLIALFPIACFAVAKLILEYGEGQFGTLVGGLLYGIAFILSLLSSMATIYALRDNSDVTTSYRSALPRLRGFIWLTVVTIAVMLGGVVMLVVPFFIFCVWFLFASYVFVDEGTGGLAALLKSKEYARGHWWAIVGRCLLLWLVAIVIMIPLGIIIAFLPDTLEKVFAQVPQLLLAPFTTAAFWILYNSLKSSASATPQSSRVGRGFLIFSAILGILFPFIVILALLVGAIAGAPGSA